MAKTIGLYRQICQRKEEVFFIAKKTKKGEVKKIAPKKAAKTEAPKKTAGVKKQDKAWKAIIWILIIILVIYLISRLFG